MNNEDPKIYNLGILEEKTYAFALRIIKAYNFLTSKNEYVLSKQLLRAGTSIGANCREATYAQSKMDFINKLSIALKEANETIYWLELLHDSDFIDDCRLCCNCFTPCGRSICASRVPMAGGGG